MDKEISLIIFLKNVSFEFIAANIWIRFYSFIKVDISNGFKTAGNNWNYLCVKQQHRAPLFLRSILSAEALSDLSIC